MSYNQEWDRLLNPHRYDAEGNLTEAARHQDVRMRLNSAGSGGKSGGGAGDLKVEIPALDRAGKRAYEIHGRLSRATAEPDKSTYAAHSALSSEGFALGVALRDVITTWDEKSRHLCAAFSKLQNALWSGARDIELTENAATDSMNDYMKRYR